MWSNVRAGSGKWATSLFVVVGFVGLRARLIRGALGDEASILCEEASRSRVAWLLLKGLRDKVFLPVD